MEKKRELACAIIGMFEELLDNHGIDIPNDERDSEIESIYQDNTLSKEEKEELASEFAHIFGTDYYDLENSIVDYLTRVENSSNNDSTEKNHKPTWVENEVRLACERECKCDDECGNETCAKYNRKSGECIDTTAEYACNVYKSALKAYKSLCDDGHTGMSIAFTRKILNRMISHLPLTPIEDTDDIWVNPDHSMSDEYVTYQCKRMTSLFKEVYNDGTVKYHDVNRVRCYHIDDDPMIGSSFGFISNIIHEMFPIEFPYYPSSEPFRVFREEFLHDTKNGDFDTIAIRYVIKPDGTRVDINKFYTEYLNTFIEIDEDTYYKYKDERVDK